MFLTFSILKLELLAKNFVTQLDTSLFPNYQIWKKKKKKKINENKKKKKEKKKKMLSEQKRMKYRNGLKR